MLASGAGNALREPYAYPAVRILKIIESSPRSLLVATVFAALTVVAFNIVGLTDLVLRTFAWHVEQVEFTEGLVELAVVAMVVFAGLLVGNRFLRALIPLAGCIIYLRLHAVDLALFASVVYVSGIYAIGAVACMPSEKTRRTQGQVFQTHALRFSMGIAVLAVLLLLPSLLWGLSYGAVRFLALTSCVLGLLVAWLLGRLPSLSLPEKRPSVFMAASLAMLSIVVLAVMARSNSVIFYDSIWYGMRPDRVLFGPTGFYDYLGLTTQVHYYPKLYELLISPLQEWNDTSFAIGFGVCCLMFFSAAVYSLAKSFGMSSWISIGLAIAMTALPAVAGTAETTKGDLLASAFVLMAIVALKFSRDREDPSFLTDVIVFALLASAARLSVLPWLAILFVLFFFCLSWQTYRSPQKVVTWLKSWDSCLIAMALLAFGLVHYRTWLLTGTPIVTNDSTQKLFDALGFGLKYPIGGFTGSSAPEGLGAALSYIHELALAPSQYTYHAFKWMGATWLAMAAFGIGTLPLLGKRYFDDWHGKAILLAFGLGFPLLLGYNAWVVKGGDGNYFVVPIVCLSIFGASCLDRRSVLLACSLLIAGALAFIAYFAGSNWVQGTSGFKTSLVESPFDEDVQLEKYLDVAGMARLGKLIASCGDSTRVLGLLPDPYAFALPVSYEPLTEITWNNRKALGSASAFGSFISATGTQLLIMPTSIPSREPAAPRKTYELAAPLIRKLTESGVLEKVQVAEGGVKAYLVTAHPPSRQCLLGLRGIDNP